MQSIFFALIILLVTFLGGGQGTKTQTQQDSGRRLVYEAQEYIQESGQYQSHSVIHSVNLDGTDDRIIFEGSQPSGLRGIVAFPLDDRLLIIQEPKSWMVFTTTGEDVTSQYDFTKIENDVQRVSRLRSPDGKKIAFATPADLGMYTGEEVERSTVYVVDQTTGQRKTFTDPSFDLGIISIYPAAWSPDGRLLYIMSSIWEGPAELHMWRIDTETGEIYKYKSTDGLLALGMHLDATAGVGVGVKVTPGGDLSDPLKAPSEVVFIDLDSDTARIIKKSDTTLLFDAYPINNGKGAIFVESLDEGLNENSIREWGDQSLQHIQFSDSSSEILQTAQEGLHVFDVVDGRFIVYGIMSRIDERTDGYEYHAYDLESKTGSLLVSREGVAGVRVLGIF